MCMYSFDIWGVFSDVRSVLIDFLIDDLLVNKFI